MSTRHMQFVVIKHGEAVTQLPHYSQPDGFLGDDASLMVSLEMMLTSDCLCSVAVQQEWRCCCLPAGPQPALQCKSPILQTCLESLDLGPRETPRPSSAIGLVHSWWLGGKLLSLWFLILTGAESCLPSVPLQG